MGGRDRPRFHRPRSLYATMMRRFEADLFREYFQLAGTLTEAAKMLGLPRSTLSRRARLLGVEMPHQTADKPKPPKTEKKSNDTQTGEISDPSA